MIKKPHKFKLYDVGYKLVTNTLILTFIGLVSKIGYDVYYWKRYQLPMRKEETKRLMEEEMARKQEKEAAELAKQENLLK